MRWTIIGSSGNAFGIAEIAGAFRWLRLAAC